MSRDRNLGLITAEALVDGLRRTPLQQFVIWTGDELHGVANSRLARVLSCIAEPDVPLSLRAIIQRAARLEGDFGVCPNAARNAIRQHQCAQPAVLLLVERQASGDFTAAADIAFAGVSRRRFQAGQVVLSARDAAQRMRPSRFAVHVA